MITYLLKTNDLGIKYIEMHNSDNPNSISVIPINVANSDYQAYLKSVDADKL